MYLDDDDGFVVVVVVVVMMELAAVPLFFLEGTNFRLTHIASFLVHIYFIPD